MACVAALLLSGSALAQDRATAKWFRYGAGVDQSWHIAEDATRPFHVTVSPKGDRSRSPKRVLVLYPRPSSAYDIAITKILQVFRPKTIDAEFRVINFEMDDKRGREALRFAEDEKFRPDLRDGLGVDGLALRQLSRRRDPGRLRLLQGPGAARTDERLHERQQDELRFHLAECARRSSDDLRQGAEPRSQEPRGPRGYQKRQRGPDPGGAI